MPAFSFKRMNELFYYLVHLIFVWIRASYLWLWFWFWFRYFLYLRHLVEFWVCHFILHIWSLIWSHVWNRWWTNVLLSSAFFLQETQNHSHAYWPWLNSLTSLHVYSAVCTCYLLSAFGHFALSALSGLSPRSLFFDFLLVLFTGSFGHVLKTCLKFSCTCTCCILQRKKI